MTGISMFRVNRLLILADLKISRTNATYMLETCWRQDFATARNYQKEYYVLKRYDDCE